MEEELDLLRRLHRGHLTTEELMEIFYGNRDRYRVLLQLAQQPQFPEKVSLNIIPKFYPMDLVRIVKNKRANPYIRKRAELEFANKYQRFPLGEKLSYMKIIPASLLEYFLEEKDLQVLAVIFTNPYCTEELVVKMINRYTPRFKLYQVLAGTEWYKRPQVCEAICHDPQAPIRILSDIIPYLNVRQLEKLYTGENTHRNIKDNIIRHMRQRKAESED
ncbi:MAG: hypothetical protein GY940_35480 [bacterium]|nr:hypothetical protein [bacterium]